MTTVNSLLKKRQKLEQQIAQAQRREKRKAEIAALFEKRQLLDLTDEQILAALKPQSAPSSASAATGDTP